VTIAYSAGAQTLQEDYCSSSLDHVIKIQDVWVTSPIFQLQYSRITAPSCSSAGVAQAYLEE
jgi:hypothetical protein